jgi:two-component system, NtrC family, sensor kinase
MLARTAVCAAAAGPAACAQAGGAGARKTLSNVRINWRVKAVLPVALVLLAGVAAFVGVALSLNAPERSRVILVAAGGAVVICAALLAALAILIQRPLNELQEKIARLRSGDLSVSVSFAGRNDEIGDLGRHFNEMVNELREGREKLQRMHQTQMSRAEHLAMLGELAAGLAHEIRNPLAGIAGVIEIIGQELPSTSPARDVWKEVQQEVLHIKKILSDLLDYARPKPPDIRAANLHNTVEHAVSLARHQTMSKPIEIQVALDGALPPVEHDETQIQQVLLNLLLNALQAIEGAGTVRVALEPRRDFAVVRVSDTGRGIRQEDVDRVFRPFFTTKGQGTGLGLSLARRIVEGHGGHIEVKSEPGQGSEFSVWLPFRKQSS